MSGACIMVPLNSPFSSGHKGSQWCPQAAITDPILPLLHLARLYILQAMHVLQASALS